MAQTLLDPRAIRLVVSMEEDRSMMDLLFLIVVVGFFAGAIAYVEGCERL